MLCIKGLERWLLLLLTTFSWVESSRLLALCCLHELLLGRLLHLRLLLLEVVHHLLGLGLHLLAEAVELLVLLLEARRLLLHLERVLAWIWELLVLALARELILALGWELVHAH